MTKTAMLKKLATAKRHLSALQYQLRQPGKLEDRHPVRQNEMLAQALAVRSEMQEIVDALAHSSWHAEGIRS